MSVIRSFSLEIFVRSANENTEAECINRLKWAFPSCRISLIKEKPFYRALRKGIELASASSCQWSLVIDADVLVDEEKIVDMVRFAIETNKNVFAVQGYVIDYFMAAPRMAGNHLYRNEFLSEALMLLENSVDPRTVRPETTLINQMESEKKRAWISYPAIIGLHDFYQSSHDIYRKCMFHAQKNRQNIDRIFSVATSGLISHKECRLVVLGVIDGLYEEKKLLPDIDQELYKKQKFDNDAVVVEPGKAWESVQNFLKFNYSRNDIYFLEVRSWWNLIIIFRQLYKYKNMRQILTFFWRKFCRKVIQL